MLGKEKGGTFCLFKEEDLWEGWVGGEKGGKTGNHRNILLSKENP